MCGSCTVLLDDRPARSCISFAVALDGGRVRTVEGFETDAVMEKLRDAFRREHGVQCGFCTSGMLITSHDIVTRFAAADEKKNSHGAGGQRLPLHRLRWDRECHPARHERDAGRGPASRACGKSRSGPGRRRPFRPFDALADGRNSAASSTSATQPAAGKGWLRIDDHFVIAGPRRRGRKFFADIPRVARCMPGAELISNDGRNLVGNVRVAFGPIKASFSGVASVERNDADFSGVVRGGGNDAKGGSRARGQVIYRLVDQGANSTRVNLSLEFQLQGPLAQFGRAGLVKDFASRLVAQFARNLSADLSGKPADGDRTAITAGAMLWSILWGLIRGRSGRQPGN